MAPTLTLAAGLSIGFGLSALERGAILPALLLLALAGIGEWLQVRLGPLGGFTLRPVFAFVGLWAGGPPLFLLVGVLPVVLVRLFVRRSSLREALFSAGRDAPALWAGWGAHALAGWLTTALGPGWPGEAVTRSAGLLGYWAVGVPLQALALGYSEGIRLRAAFGHLVHHGWLHIAALSAAALAMGYVASSFGLVVTALAAVMLVEAYYPWKLLGDQGGVLLTSLEMMAQAVDLKDPYTSNHSLRVSQYAIRIAREMGLPESEVERIRIGALMHDIGKIGISGRIIRKPGKLTPEEQALMREHSSVSANIIEPLEILGESAKMVRHHHENWDGTGYPDGLAGEEIPLASRIIFVADAFDALVTDRPYRRGATRAEALDVLRRHAGTQFDAAVVATLEQMPILVGSH